MLNANIYIIIAGNSKVPANWRTDHRAYAKGIQRLYYIKSGKGKMLLESGAELPFAAGKIYLMPNNMKQSFVSDETDRIDHIYFDFYSFPPIISDEPIIYDVSESPILAKQIAFIDELTLLDRRASFGDNRPDISVHSYSIIKKSAPAGSEEEYIQLVKNSFLGLLMTLSSIRELPFVQDEAITRVLEYIFQHYAEPISLETLAREVGYERHYLIRRFRSVMLETPYAFLRGYRLERARDLLEEGQTVTEVAPRVGYANPDSLYKALGKHVRT